MTSKRFVLYFCALSLCCVIASGRWVVPPPENPYAADSEPPSALVWARALWAARDAHLRAHDGRRVAIRLSVR